MIKIKTVSSHWRHKFWLVFLILFFIFILMVAFYFSFIFHMYVIVTGWLGLIMCCILIVIFNSIETET